MDFWNKNEAAIFFGGDIAKKPLWSPKLVHDKTCPKHTLFLSDLAQNHTTYVSSATDGHSEIKFGVKIFFGE